MREIKFRGKRIRPKGVKDAWAYGSLIQKIESTEIHDGVFTWFIHPETVGQFIGLKDKNGKEIYEGDIVHHPVYGNCYIFFSKKHLAFCYEYTHIFSEGDIDDPKFEVRQIPMCGDILLKDIVIVGNIHDNPELIKN